MALGDPGKSEPSVLEKVYGRTKKPGKEKEWAKFKISDLLNSTKPPKEAKAGWFQDHGQVWVMRKIDGKLQRISLRLVVVLVQKSEDSEETTLIALFSDDLQRPADWIAHVYQKRWRIEVFFRHAKQDLGLGQCHSVQPDATYAHTALCLTADILLRIANQTGTHSNGYANTPTGSWMDRVVRRACQWNKYQIKRDPKICFAQSETDIDELLIRFTPKTIQLKLWAS